MIDKSITEIGQNVDHWSGSSSKQFELLLDYLTPKVILVFKCDCGDVRIETR